MRREQRTAEGRRLGRTGIPMIRVKTLLCGLVVTALSVGCLDQGNRTPAAGAGNYKGVALQFVTALAKRDYLQAYGMTSKEYQYVGGSSAQSAFGRIRQAMTTRNPDGNRRELPRCILKAGGVLPSAKLVGTAR